MIKPILYLLLLCIVLKITYACNEILFNELLDLHPTTEQYLDIMSENNNINITYR